MWLNFSGVDVTLVIIVNTIARDGVQVPCGEPIEPCRRFVRDVQATLGGVVSGTQMRLRGRRRAQIVKCLGDVEQGHARRYEVYTCCRVAQGVPCGVLEKGYVIRFGIRGLRLESTREVGGYRQFLLAAQRT